MSSSFSQLFECTPDQILEMNSRILSGSLDKPTWFNHDVLDGESSLAGSRTLEMSSALKKASQKLVNHMKPSESVYGWLMAQLQESQINGYGIVLAGGFICRFLAAEFTGTKYGINSLIDLDLFLFGFKEQGQADEYATKLADGLIKFGYQKSEMSKVIQFNRSGRSPIQLMLRSLPQPIQIVSYFDVLVSQCWFDGIGINCSLPAAWSFVNKILLADTTRNASTFAVRLKKYQTKIVPGFKLRFDSVIEAKLNASRQNLVDLNELQEVQQASSANNTQDDEYVNDLPDDSSSVSVDTQTLINKLDQQAKIVLDSFGSTSATTPFGLFVKHASQQYDNEVKLDSCPTDGIIQKMKDAGHNNLFSYISYIWQTSGAETKSIYVRMSHLARQRKLERLSTDVVQQQKITQQEFSQLRKDRFKRYPRNIMVSLEIKQKQQEQYSRYLLHVQQFIATAKNQMYAELREAAKILRRLRKFDQGDQTVLYQCFNWLLENKTDGQVAKWANSKLPLKRYLLDDYTKYDILDGHDFPKIVGNEDKLDILLASEMFYWFPGLNMVINRTTGSSVGEWNLEVIPLGTKVDIGMSSNWVDNLDTRDVHIIGKQPITQVVDTTSSGSVIRNWRNLMMATLQKMDFFEVDQIKQLPWDIDNDSKSLKIDFKVICYLSNQMGYTKIFQSLGLLHPNQAKELAQMHDFLIEHDSRVLRENRTKLAKTHGISRQSNQTDVTKVSLFFCQVIRNLNLINQHIRAGNLVGKQYMVDLLDANNPKQCIWNWQPVDPRELIHQVVARETLSEVLMIYGTQFMSVDNYHQIMQEGKPETPKQPVDESAVRDLGGMAELRDYDCRGTPFGDFLFEYLQSSIIPYLSRERINHCLFTRMFQMFLHMPYQVLREYVERYPNKPSGLNGRYW